jgi:pectate lyase
MNRHHVHRASVAVLLGAFGASAALSCSSSEGDGQPTFPPPAATGGTGGTAPIANAGAGGGASGAGGSSALGQGGGLGAGASEGVDPGGLAGSGSGATTGSGSGGTAPVSNTGGSGGEPAATGGTGGNPGAGGTDNLPQDCNTPPPASPLIGWASVAGRGVTTTTGGGNAAPTEVTTLAQLNAALAGTNPAVIHVRGELEPGDVRFGSNKTVIGLCGAEIHGHLEFTESVNVIVRNVTIVGYGEGDCALDPGFDAAEGCSSGDDAVTVQRNSHHIWFDHCAVRDGTDGNLDVSNAADFVTISFTKFSYTPRTDNVGSDSTGAAGHRYSNLVGGTDEPDDFDDANALNVTWHHNWWADNVVERQPRIRFGQNHLFNNYWNSLTTNYCVRAGIDANILLEGNVFDGVDDPHEFNNADDQTTAFITAGNTNVYINTTSDQAVGGGGTPFTDPPYDYTLENAATVEATVTSQAGPQ